MAMATKVITTPGRKDSHLRGLQTVKEDRAMRITSTRWLRFFDASHGFSRHVFLEFHISRATAGCVAKGIQWNQLALKIH
jgi:hypothetical protein